MSDRGRHFQTVGSWVDAGDFLAFVPRVPGDAAGCALQSLAIHVMDHRRRRLSRAERSLEAHYGRFVLEQRRARSPEEAKRLACKTAYGPDASRITVGGSAGRCYALGPPVDANDVDGRRPAVVVWSDGDEVFFIASTELDHTVLIAVANSMQRLAS